MKNSPYPIYTQGQLILYEGPHAQIEPSEH